MKKLKLLLILALAPLLMGNLQFKNAPQVTDNAIDTILDTVTLKPKIEKAYHDTAPAYDINYYINNMARKLGVNYDALFRVIAFETGFTFDPTITNKYSGARGLIQFTNSTSKTMVDPLGKKLKDANDLVRKYPTFAAQMALPGYGNPYGGPVYQYLRRFGKFKSDKSLYLAVFYPAAINWADDHPLPDVVKKQNPGVSTIGDYYASMARKTMFSDKIDTD